MIVKGRNLSIYQSGRQIGMASEAYLEYNKKGKSGTLFNVWVDIKVAKDRGKIEFELEYPRLFIKGIVFPTQTAEIDNIFSIKEIDFEAREILTPEEFRVRYPEEYIKKVAEVL